MEFLVIDDGSRDRTVAVARELGVQHIVRHTRNMGLGRSFHDGVMKALELGADILVNTDGDNQYPSDRLGDVIQPILDGRADIVVADRQTRTIEHFSPFKKWLQRVGLQGGQPGGRHGVAGRRQRVSGLLPEALIRLNTVTRFSYTLESIIQAGNKTWPLPASRCRPIPKLVSPGSFTAPANTW